jgi:hypothetical protein
MRKNIIVFFVMTLFLLTTIPAFGILNDDQMDQHQIVTNNRYSYVCDEQWCSQSFKPSLNIITKVELLLLRWSALDEAYLLTVSIKDKLANDSKFDLTSVSLIPNLSRGHKSWILFDFPDIALDIGRTYYIVIRAYNGSYGESGVKDNECYGWARNYDDDSYPRGNYNYSRNHGMNWYYYIGDTCFKTYGYYNSKPSTPNRPSGTVAGATRREYN